MKLVEQQRIRLFAQRRVIDLGLLEDHLAIIAITAQLHHLCLRVQQRDRRQEAGALDAITVQLIGRHVRRGYQDNALLEQAA